MMKTILTLTIASLLLVNLSFSQQLDFYVSKQTGEICEKIEGTGTKTTDRYEHGSVAVSSTGPILWDVVPQDFSIGINQTKTWDGWIMPDVDAAPPPGHSALATLTADYNVFYSCPAEMGCAGGVVGGYACDACPYHENGGAHNIHNNTGTLSMDFMVHSILIEVPDVCIEVGKSISVNAETYPTYDGQVIWETQSNEISIDANDRTAVITGNITGIYIVSATLSICDVTYNTEFVVKVCEVELIPIESTQISPQVCINSQEEFMHTKFKAKVLPSGTVANVNVEDGNVELSKKQVSDGDIIVVTGIDIGKYKLKITHECSDNINNEFESSVFMFKFKFFNYAHIPIRRVGTGATANAYANSNHHGYINISTSGINTETDINFRTRAALKSSAKLKIITDPPNLFNGDVEAIVNVKQNVVYQGNIVDCYIDNGSNGNSPQISILDGLISFSYGFNDGGVGYYCRSGLSVNGEKDDGGEVKVESGSFSTGFYPILPYDTDQSIGCGLLDNLWKVGVSSTSVLVKSETYAVVEKHAKNDRVEDGAVHIYPYQAEDNDNIFEIK